MQLGGISGHSTEMHHVTNCIHPHAGQRQEVGGPEASMTNIALQTLQNKEEQQTAQFSLQDILRKALGGGKRLLGKLWGSSDTGVSGQSGRETGFRMSRRKGSVEVWLPGPWRRRICI